MEEALETIALIKAIIKTIPDEAVTPEEAMILLQLALTPKPKPTPKTPLELYRTLR